MREGLLLKITSGLMVLLGIVTPVHGAQTRAQSASQAVPVLHIDSLGKATVEVDGPWQFHAGDDPGGQKGWASQSLDDTAWDQVTTEQPWGAQAGHESLTGYAWYRRHIEVTPAHGSPPDFHLLIRHVDDAYELYWNGELVARNGSFPPRPAWYNDQAAQIFGLPGGLAVTSDPSLSGVLAVRVWKAPLFSYDSGNQGGFSAPPLIGSAEAIRNQKAALDYQWLRTRQFIFALDCLVGLMAILSLLAWLRDRSQAILFWMAGFSIAPLAILVLDGLRLPWPFHISLALQQPMYSIEDICLWFMLLWILDFRHTRRIFRLTVVLAYVSLGTTLLDGLVAFGGWSIVQGAKTQNGIALLDGILTTVFTVTEILPLGLISYAFWLVVKRRQRLDLIRWLVASTAFLTVMTSVVQVAAAQGSRFTHWTLAERIAAPLFVWNGNPISAYTFFRTLLVVSLIYAVYRYYAQAGQRSNVLEREMQSARELQQVLIPETPPSVPGFTLTGAYRPANEVGGDFFQIIPLDKTISGKGSTLILLGDVSGKGLKAAMAVAVILGAARALAPFFTDPALLLAELNQSLHNRLQGAFATCVILRVDHLGHCLIASAGHPSPFLNDRELTLPGALPLALAAGATYEDLNVTLSVGDRLSLYTDGLLEARNAEGELYSFDRLQRLFASKPTAEEATEAAVLFGQDDDITVLTLTRQPANYREPRSLSDTQTIRIYPTLSNPGV